MTTIKDLARISGLSIGTISRYLNGYEVKEKTKIAIERAIEQTGYIRNPIARSMKTGKSMTVAVVVPNLANMFSMRVIESVEHVLEKEGYSVIVSDCGGDAQKQLEKLETLKYRMVDGFVLMPLTHSADAVAAALGGIPLVLIDRLLDKPAFDSVTVSNFEAAYRETARMLSGGLRKIGIIEGPDDIYTATERKRGFEQAVSEFGAENIHRTCGGYNISDGYTAMQKLLKHDLEGVFISNYELTVGAMQAYAESGAAPDMLVTVGFDSVEISKLVNKSMACISQPIEQIGEVAARLLLARMREPDKPIENVIIKI